MPIFQNPVDQSPEEYVAERTLQEAATRSAGAYVAEAVSGQNPATYDEQWADIAGQFREQFPGVDMERAQSVYQSLRHQSATQGLTFTPQGGRESATRSWVGRIPVAGGFFQSTLNEEDAAALERIRENRGTLDDYAQYRERQAHQEFLGNRGTLRAAGETVVDSAAFAADFAAVNVATAGFGSIAMFPRLAALTPRVAQSAIRGIGIANAMPGRVAASVTGELIPDVARDESGALHIGGNRGWGDAFRGYLDHQIEIWSEMSGEALLGGAGRVLNRLGAGRAQAVAAGLAARIAPNPRMRAALSQFGYTNMLGEFLEERAGELARGATGGDAGMIGNVAGGRYMEALNQLAVEGLAFGGMQAGVSGASMAANRISRSPGAVAIQSLRSQGLTEAQARDQVMAATESIANGTATPEDVRPGPLRTLAEAVQEQIEQAEAIQTPMQEAVEQAQTVPTAAEIAAPAENAVPNEAVPVQESAQNLPSATAPLPRPTGEPTQQPGFMRPLQGPPRPPVPAPVAPPAAPQAPSPTQTPPDALAGQPEALPVAPGPAEAAPTMQSLWFRHLGGDAAARSAINQAAKLTPREAQVFWGHLRVEQGGEGLSMPKLGQRLGGVSRQRIEQIEKKARAKAEFDVSVAAFNRQAEGLSQEGSTLKTRKEMGVSSEGFQARETPERPEDMVSDKMLAILQETDATGRPLTDAQKQAVYTVCADLMEKVQNDARRSKGKGFTAERIEKAFRAGIEAAENRTAGAQTRDPDPAAAGQTVQPAAPAQAVQAQPAVPGSRSLMVAGEGRAITGTGPYNSNAHAAVAKTIADSIQTSGLPAEKAGEFLRNLTVLSHFNERFMGLMAQNLKGVDWHVSTRALTDTLAAVSPEVAKAKREGKQVGGTFDRETGRLDLDGDAPSPGRRKPGNTGRQIYAHEFGHVIDGAAFVFSSTTEWQAAHAEASSLSAYAQESPQESFAEFARLVGEGSSLESLREQYPAMTAFWEKNGLVGSAGVAEAKPLQDIFDKPIEVGSKHVDILKRLSLFTEQARAPRRSLMTVSPELEAARRHVNPTGKRAEVTKPADAAAALAFELRQRADDRLAIAADIVTAVNKKRARLGLPAFAPGTDLRTVIAGTEPQVKAWAEEMAGKGMFSLEKQQDGSRVQRTIGKSADWIVEGLGYKPEDLQASGTGRIADLKRTVGMDVEQAPSRLDTALIALHAVHQVERGQAMLEKYLTFITPEQEALAARLINTISTEQLEAFDAYLEHERVNDPAFFAAANESLRRITQLYDLTLDALQSVGWYSAEDVARIKRDYPDYVSMARVLESDDLARASSGAEIKPGWEKKRHGSGLQIVSPITSLQSRYAETAFIMAKQLQNEALLQSMSMLEGDYAKPADVVPRVRLTDIEEKLSALGINAADRKKLIDVVGPELIEYFGMPKWDANGQNFYIYRENGQRKALEITSKPLYELLTNNQEPTAIVGGVTQAMLAVPGLKEIPKLTKWGATQANLVFPIRNMTRDVWTALQNGEGAPLERIGRLVMGHATAFKAAGQNLMGGEISDVYARLYQKATGQELREFAYTRAGKGAAAFRKLQGATPGQEKTVQLFHKVQDVLEVIGAGEQGPRIGAWKQALQDLGYTEAKIEAALKADPSASPIPLNVMLYARQKAATSTVDFSRQGIDTREANRIIPFLSARIAGLSQESRNWNKAVDEFKQGKIGPWSKAMLGTLAAYLGYELMHWWFFKDEDWYKNQPAHLRYDWWNLHQDSQGRLWGVPKPKGIMAMVGAQFQEGLRAISDSESRPGMAAGFAAQQLSPEVLPVGVAQAFQLARNSDWRGAAIVPQRDLQEMNAWEQFRTHQLPYVLDQLSGGLASGRIFRGPQEAFRSSRGEPTLPVNEYFERLAVATAAHNRAQRSQQRLSPEEQREYMRLHAIERAMRNLSAEARRRPEKMLEIRRRQNELARRALA